MAALSQSDPHRREPGQRRPMCGACKKPLRLRLCGRLRSPPVETAVASPCCSTRWRPTTRSTPPASPASSSATSPSPRSPMSTTARFLLTTRGASGAAESDLGGGGDGEIDVQNGDNLGRCEAERSEHALPPDGICGQSDEKAGAIYDFEKIAPNACGDLDEEGVSIGGPSEMLDHGDVRDGILCGLVGEVGSLDCGHNGCGSLGFKMMKSDGQHSDFKRSSSGANQIGNYGVNAINGESSHISETGLAYKATGNLSHPALANVLEVRGMIHHCNGIGKENDEVNAAFGQDWTMKNMDKCTIAYTKKELRIDIERGVKPKIGWLSRGPLGEAAVSNSFVVTKIQSKKSKLTGEVTEFEEFSITIPPKSALLFPCQRAISIDASGCAVQHLIVLDGTWAKAQRMYHENPWLQLLPHVKLESDRVSLYSEVRHEPRAGCLSTIESIVVAMRKLGEDSKGLDDLLDVFESMIADQRRCKDENCKQKLKS